jgi:aspartyl-tRNA(Asn)/glutamyl-tRNA(Gln) amidotransferase subunit B
VKGWEIVVGIETHTQLLTKSKMFSGAANAFGAAPNTQASTLDIALPGTLPVANRAAVEHAIRFGLAVKGRISPRSIFARKNYFYPDLPKGYQISQYETPVVQGGEVSFFINETEKRVKLTRAHLEEDAGKSLHELSGSHAALGQGMTGIDLNRAGTPLLEIVTEPELRGAQEAVAYARTLHALVVWIGICDGNMQEGSFRCDANVSVRKAGDGKLGTRCEIKNLNSFRFMEQAIEFEAKRQIEILEDGGRIAQETRLYDPDRNETRPMRSKEDAQDYRYFPDPDLLPLIVTERMVEEIRHGMPELPDAKKERFKSQYALSAYDASALTSQRAMADYFEETAKIVGDPKLGANWVTGEVAAFLNKFERFFDQPPVSAGQLGRLLVRIKDGTISNKIAKDVFEGMCAANGFAAAIDDHLHYPRLQFSNDNLADEIIEKRGLKQISDSGEIERLVDEVLKANAKQVEDYRAGKEKAFNSLVGQVMKATQGKANPAQVNEILRAKLRR